MCNPENIRVSGDKLVSELSIICHLLEAQKSGPAQAEAPLSGNRGLPEASRILQILDKTATICLKPAVTLSS